MMELLGRIVPFFVGALVTYLVLPSDPIAYPEVIVPAARIEVREMPAEPPSIVERVRYVFIAPRQVATAPQAAVNEVSAFCRPVVRQETLQESTHPPEPPTLVLRSGSHRNGSWWNPLAKDELLLTGFTNYGDLTQAEYSVRNGFAFRTSGDSVLVRHGRGAFVADFIDLLGRASLVFHALQLGGVL